MITLGDVVPWIVSDILKFDPPTTQVGDGVLGSDPL
jgi:hypothetical protein